MKNNLLIQFNKLFISNVDNLYTHLIKEIYLHQVIVHSERIKTIKLLIN